MPEGIPSKTAGRVTTWRPRISGEIISAGNEDDPVLHDVIGVPPGSRNATANEPRVLTRMPIGDFEPEEHRRPRVTPPATPLRAVC